MYQLSEAIRRRGEANSILPTMLEAIAVIDYSRTAGIPIKSFPNGARNNSFKLMFGQALWQRLLKSKSTTGVKGREEEQLQKSLDISCFVFPSKPASTYQYIEEHILFLFRNIGFEEFRVIEDYEITQEVSSGWIERFQSVSAPELHRILRYGYDFPYTLDFMEGFLAR